MRTGTRRCGEFVDESTGESASEMSCLNFEGPNSWNRLCRYEKRAKIATCWRGDNTGRRFLSCPLYPSVDGYRFFEWADEQLCPRVKAILIGILNKKNLVEKDLEKMRKKEKFYVVVIIVLVAVLAMSWVIKGEASGKTWKSLLRFQ